MDEFVMKRYCVHHGMYGCIDLGALILMHFHMFKFLNLCHLERLACERVPKSLHSTGHSKYTCTQSTQGLGLGLSRTRPVRDQIITC